ncbi:hypothetical protein RHSIM_Rhsim08G0138300 [Rhododendron simsii]|uniref:DUF4216 domain-containing protein n=1 Tax=Rhododendron simsii TaxID=118357 RepID=A0A834GKB7_RHOSS|nr:hypothetical protein RHSIM_Rhsim08G0138300 [Rhododendron simsii]
MTCTTTPGALTPSVSTSSSSSPTSSTASTTSRLSLYLPGSVDPKALHQVPSLCRIWELRYLHGGTVVLFECEWYNTGQRSRIYNDECVTSIDVSRLWYKDDPFVLPSQVRQVFYVNDTSKGKNWRVVERVRHRGVWDVPEQDDVSNNAFQQDEPTDGIPIHAEDTNISYNKDDVDPEIVGDDELMEDHIDDNNDEDDSLAEYVDDEEDELNRQPDFDIDLDIDCDI